jgi:hypothetical protein
MNVLRGLPLIRIILSRTHCAYLDASIAMKHLAQESHPDHTRSNHQQGNRHFNRRQGP